MVRAVAFPAQEALLDEITEFLLTRPTAEDIIASHAFETLDARLHKFLDKNSAGVLDRDERAELDRFLQLNHMLIVLKAKARQRRTEIQ